MGNIIDSLVNILGPAILSCINGHANYPQKAGVDVRNWDKETPYAVHALWCAMTFLQETKLPKDIMEKRNQCALALMFHDFKEDTSLPLPDWLPQGVLELVDLMTFSGEVGSTAIEIQQIWDRPPIIRLLKLYDKVSNLLDGTWMSDEKWNDQYVPYVLKLTEDVEANYGNLNIVRIAQAIAIPRSNLISLN